MAVIFIIIGSLIIYAIWKNSKSKKEAHKEEGKVKISVLTSTDGKTYHDVKDSDWESHRKQMRLRDRNRERKHTIWSILRFMITYKDLIENTTDFYQFRDNLAAFKTAKGEMRKRHPDACALDTAIRFCQMESFYGTCNHKLTENDIQTIYNWKELNVDEEKLLNIVLSSFESYWKGVLNSYVRPSARTKRIAYLIQELDNVKEIEGVRSYPKVLDRLDQLQQQYRDMLPS
ncbi:MAG: hypothetical protein ACFNVH_00690 [Segatella maculosa]